MFTFAWGQLHRSVTHSTVLVILGILASDRLDLLAQEAAPPVAQPAKKLESPAGAVEVCLHDDSSLKLLLRDEKIELETVYGKLEIPVADVIRIDFSLRISDEAQKKLSVAITDLANADFRHRQAASDTLISLREKAYPALLEAAKSNDMEVARRAEQALEKLRDLLPEEALEFPATDVIYTAHSKIAGRIKAASFRVTTVPFGDQQLKLADLRSLRSQHAPAAEKTARNVQPDPGTLAGFNGQAGQTVTFRVTAEMPGVGSQGTVYGSNVYTMDSRLALAAVHAGALKPGQTGIVRVTLVGPQDGFQASTQNGITSFAYGPWDGFRIDRPKNAAARKRP